VQSILKNEGIETIQPIGTCKAKGEKNITVQV
jgi:hypothetical protein